MVWCIAVVVTCYHKNIFLLGVKEVILRIARTVLHFMFWKQEELRRKQAGTCAKAQYLLPLQQEVLLGLACWLMPKILAVGRLRRIQALPGLHGETLSNR